MAYATRGANLTRPQGHFAALLGVAVVAVAVGCRRPSPSPTNADASPVSSSNDGDAAVALDVEIAGCAALVRQGTGLVCETAGGATLRWVLPPGSRAGGIQLLGDGVPLVPSTTTAPLTTADEDVVPVTVPPSTKTLTVVAASTASRPARTYSMALTKVTSAAWLEDARALRARGDAEGARRLLSGQLEAPDGVLRALATSALARVELAAGRMDQALALFRRAIDLHRKTGRVSDVIDDSFALAFALNQRSHHYAEARLVLDDVSRELAGYPEGRARLPYYRAVLAAETGDHRTALVLLREAESRAKRLGMDRLVRTCISTGAVEMQALGRAAASLDSLVHLVAAPGLTPCEMAGALNNLGWGALLANEARESPLHDARGPLERSLAVEGCSDVYERAFALANLARLALREGDLSRADAALRQARATVKEPRGTERLAWLELEGQLAVAQGRPQAGLHIFDDLLAKSRAAVLLIPEWSALVGRATALERLGKVDDALLALAAAERLVDDALVLVPLGEGRSFFASDLARATRTAISLLVMRGRLEEAASMARRSRSRVLSSVARSLRLERLSGPSRRQWETAIDDYRKARSALDAEASRDWELATDALAAAREVRKEKEQSLRTALDAAMALVAIGKKEGHRVGDPHVRDGDRRAISVVVHPVREGWRAFVEKPGGRFFTVRIPSPTTDRPGAERAVAQAIAPDLIGIAIVHFSGYGTARDLDMQSVALEGEMPLGVRVAIDYPLGLSHAPEDETSRDHVVVVGDPSGDLPEALAEAREVGSVLEKLGPAQLLLRDRATSAALSASLRGATILHYAGHGTFGGLDGMESELPLAAGGRLTVGDILAAAPVPPRIVLAGCEAARSEGDVEGLGIAQAFVVAGAREVLAPVRKVSDHLARRFALETARAVADGASTLAEAARRAAFRLSEQTPDADWAAFRVITR